MLLSLVRSSRCDGTAGAGKESASVTGARGEADRVHGAHRRPWPDTRRKDKSPFGSSQNRPKC